MNVQSGLRAAEKHKERVSYSQSTLSSEVVTELFIGPPTTR